MISRVTVLLMSLASLCLPAGASADTGSNQPPGGLPPQSLAPGECGAFFWDRAEPNPLVLFENESLGSASLWMDGAIFPIVTQPRPFAYQSGQPVLRRYEDGIHSVSVTGEVTALRGREAIIGRALMRWHQADGAEIVRPVLGLISCRE